MSPTDGGATPDLFLRAPKNLGSDNPATAFNKNISDYEDSDSSYKKDRSRFKEFANDSGVPIMERLSATFKKKKEKMAQAATQGSTNVDIKSNKPFTTEQLFIVR
jgi:hypothetical protein